MNGLEEHPMQCPYCGALQTLLVEPSAGEQEYVEDCRVCCHPVVVRVRVSAGGIRIEARRENA